MKDAAPETYAKFYKNELMTAAYLGYSDVGIFRAFRFQPVVLLWFLLYHEACQNRMATVALQLIRDIEDLETTFPKDIDALLKMYPIVAGTTREAQRASNSNRDYIYAAVLLHLAQDSKNHRSIESQSQQEIVSRFERRLSVKLPDTSKVKLQWPILDFEPGEEKLENYSRVNALLKSLQHVTALTKWRDTFFKAKNPFEAILIATDSIPAWMRASDAVLDTPKLENEIPRRSIKNFVLTCDRSKRTKFALELEKHIDRFIEFNGLRLPNVSVLVERDPRAYPTGEMWRDTIRRQLQLADLKVDLLTMNLTWDSIPVQTHCVYDANNSDAAISWMKVQTHLAKDEVKTFNFVYTLRVLDSEDDMDDFFEYSGPPLALIGDIQLSEDNDVVLLKTSNHDEISTNIIRPRMFPHLVHEQEIVLNCFSKVDKQ